MFFILFAPITFAQSPCPPLAACPAGQKINRGQPAGLCKGGIDFCSDRCTLPYPCADDQMVIEQQDPHFCLMGCVPLKTNTSDFLSKCSKPPVCPQGEKIFKTANHRNPCAVYFCTKECPSQKCPEGYNTIAIEDPAGVNCPTYKCEAVPSSTSSSSTTSKLVTDVFTSTTSTLVSTTTSKTSSSTAKPSSSLIGSSANSLKIMEWTGALASLLIFF